jgi:hypothetical protein
VKPVVALIVFGEFTGFLFWFLEEAMSQKRCQLFRKTDLGLLLALH